MSPFYNSYNCTIVRQRLSFKQIEDILYVQLVCASLDKFISSCDIMCHILQYNCGNSCTSRNALASRTTTSYIVVQ